jgi:hypothetical protein
VVDAFLAASRADASNPCSRCSTRTSSSDSTPAASPREPPVEGAEAVAALAAQVLERGSPFAAYARPAIVNGTAGVIVVPARSQSPLSASPSPTAGSRKST